MSGKTDSFIYETSPMVCSQEMKFEIEGDTIKAVEILGGCPGNLIGISNLVAGMKISDVIKKFEGISCAGKPTSCPDQMAQALKQYLARRK
ncbi:MAG: TIGR03905 family TSCPD domain-containing protein [Lentisphaeria bacterium]|nr:TIGR03905 family TSCPD domain-containing protein [Lentisphaeria bacterium]